MRLQVEQTGFGSSVKIINADTNTALRSCGMDEAVRDTVLADTSPSARWPVKATGLPAALPVMTQRCKMPS